jgi:isopenicillin-N N-acyltransferase-like protein
MMRTFELPPTASPREQGRAHGEAFRGEIQTLAEIRLHLCSRASGGSRAEVLDLAARHLPVLASFSPALHGELLGIAEGAGLEAGMVVVLNHYTDLRDIKLGAGATVAAADGCSVVFARTPAGPLAAQTWDMHASAAPFVIMLRVPDSDDQPGAWLLSLTGCLGMAGMNARGVALCINNLSATDAQIGVVWSALVRRALAQQDAAAARDLLMESPYGSGRHYLVADGQSAYAIETSGSRRSLVYSVSPDHTPILRGRLDRVALRGPDDAWQLLGSHDGYPRSVCTHMNTPELPHGPATCAGIVMSPRSGELEACAGFTHRARPERFTA